MGSAANPDVFLSYAREDAEVAAHIHRLLEQKGLDLWWDEDIHAGSGFRRDIETALNTASCVVVLWSRSSRTSDFVIDEAKVGLDREVLVPIAVDESKPPLGFQELKAISLRGWTGDENHDGFEKLCSSVFRFVESTTKLALDNEGQVTPAGSFYGRGFIFSAWKPRFGTIQFIPLANGLKVLFVGHAPIRSAEVVIPVDALAGFAATAEAFLLGLPSLDEGVTITRENAAPAFIKLFRKVPPKSPVPLFDTSTCGIRFIFGRSDDERLRIWLGPRELIALRTACQIAAYLAISSGFHRPIQSQDELATIHAKRFSPSLDPYFQPPAETNPVEKPVVESDPQSTTEVNTPKEARMPFEDLIKEIEGRLRRLPLQTETPWPVGLHKTLAAELGISNSMASHAIEYLTKSGVFLPQINGVVYLPKVSDSSATSAETIKDSIQAVLACPGCQHEHRVPMSGQFGEARTMQCESCKGSFTVHTGTDGKAFSHTAGTQGALRDAPFAGLTASVVCPACKNTVSVVVVPQAGSTRVLDCPECSVRLNLHVRSGNVVFARRSTNSATDAVYKEHTE